MLSEVQQRSLDSFVDLPHNKVWWQLTMLRQFILSFSEWCLQHAHGWRDREAKSTTVFIFIWIHNTLVFFVCLNTKRVRADCLHSAHKLVITSVLHVLHPLRDRQDKCFWVDHKLIMVSSFFIVSRHTMTRQKLIFKVWWLRSVACFFYQWSLGPL